MIFAVSAPPFFLGDLALCADVSREDPRPPAHQIRSVRLPPAGARSWCSRAWCGCGAVQQTQVMRAMVGGACNCRSRALAQIGLR